MYFYFLMIPVVIMSIYMISRLLEMRKHDQVLYRLCENRREMMAFLRKTGLTLSKDDYFALRELIEITNQTIHNYNDFKSSSFSVGKRIEYGKDVRRLDGKMQERQEHQLSNPTIKSMYSKFGQTMIIALLTFIPWPKLAIAISPFLFKLLTTIGINYARRLFDYFSWLKRRTQELAYR